MPKMLTDEAVKDHFMDADLMLQDVITALPKTKNVPEGYHNTLQALRRAVEEAQEAASDAWNHANRSSDLS
jgi:hypothetical protein